MFEDLTVELDPPRCKRDYHVAGRGDLRTTGLYDRRQQKITRNIVEKISV